MNNTVYVDMRTLTLQPIPPHSQPHWRGETVKLQSIHYFSVYVLFTFLLLWENTMTKATYRRKSLFELNGFRGVGVHHDRGTWKQTSDIAGSRELTFWTVCTEQREWTRSGSRFLISKLTPSDILPPASLHYLNPPPKHHQLGTQVFKSLKLRGIFLIQMATSCISKRQNEYLCHGSNTHRNFLERRFFLW